MARTPSFVKNTFLCFGEEEERPERRTASVPPCARLASTDLESKITASAATTASPCSTPRSVVSSECSTEASGLCPTLKRLLARPSVGATTIMVRNIPNKYSQRLLLKAWRDMGFDKCIDLFYLPMDFRKRANLGYCFANFTTEEEAMRFCRQVSGYQLPLFNSKKVLATGVAHVQGFEANFRNFCNTPKMSGNVAPEFQPLIFDPATGAEVPFPAEARRFRTPKAGGR